MPQKGTHTWDMLLSYHSCPQCGYIQENRDPFTYKSPGKYIKDVRCNRCHQGYQVTKAKHLTLGPFIGEGETAEITWD